MAKPAPKGEQVILEVRVWFDRSTRRIHMASTDPDLGPKRLHTNIKPGTAADERLRGLLAKYGKLPEDA